MAGGVASRQIEIAERNRGGSPTALRDAMEIVLFGILGARSESVTGERCGVEVRAIVEYAGALWCRKRAEGGDAKAAAWERAQIERGAREAPARDRRVVEYRSR